MTIKVSNTGVHYKYINKYIPTFNSFFSNQNEMQETYVLNLFFPLSALFSKTDKVKKHICVIKIIRIIYKKDQNINTITIICNH